MPNFELMGHGDEKGKDLRRRIFNKLREHESELNNSQLNDTTITVIPAADVKNIDGKDMPYIRIARINEPDWKKIIGYLRELKIPLDVYTPKFDSFIEIRY